MNSTKKPDLSTMSPDERRALLARLLVAKGIDPARFTLAHAAFEAAAAARPDAVAVTAPDGSVTYAELARRSAHLARRLVQAGLAREAVVAIAAERGVTAVVALLGVLRAGGAALLLDPALPDAVRAERLARAGVTFGVGLAGANGGFPVLAVDEAGESPAVELPRGPASDLALAVFEAGALARLEHHAVTGAAAWLAETATLGGEDALLVSAAPWGAGFAWQALAALGAGARLVLADGLPAEATVAVLDAAAALRTERAPGRLRLALVTGAPPGPEDAARLLDRLGADVRFVQTLAAAGGPVAWARLARAGAPLALAPAGRRTLHVLDADGGALPIGARGHVHVGGLGLARDVAGGARAFVSLAAGVEPARLLALCEHGRATEDERLLPGEPRARETFCAGERVALDAVEDALLAAGAREASVLSRRRTDGAAALVAYVVPAGLFAPDALAAAVAARLAPAERPVAFVPVARLPRLANGHVDERALERLVVPDAAALAGWERALAGAPGVQRAVIARVPREDALPRVHLQDLLPGFRSSAAPVEAPPAPALAAAAAPAARPSASSAVPALSVGPELVLPPGAPALLGEALARAVKDHPGNGTTYLAANGRETFEPYPELLANARRVTGGLRAQGLAPGDRVLLQLPDERDFLHVFWGAVLGGFVPVPAAPVKSFGQSSPELVKLAGAFALLGEPLVVAPATNAVRLADSGVHVDAKLRVVAVEDLRASAPDERAHVGQPDDVALMLLTSGSTGAAKAVMQTHRTLLARSAGANAAHGMVASDVTFNWMPLDHVGGVVMMHLSDVYAGNGAVHAPTAWVLEDALRWIDALDRYRATRSWAPNFAFGLVVAAAERAAGRSWDLSAMRVMINGGEAIVPKTARAFVTLLAPYGFAERAMVPAWGMSETCSGVAHATDFSLATTSDADSFTDLGPPIAGISLRVVDAEGNLLREGEIGRLEIRGSTVLPGYYARPELNAASFRDGWFGVGDLALLRNGRLTITGREKDVIIINGVNFYSHEIEEAAEEVPGTTRSFTAACAVREKGKNTDQAVVFFCPRPGAGDEELARLVREIRGRIVARVGVNPTHVIPVTEADIPKTAIGKIQRTQLADEFLRGRFDAHVRRLDLAAGNASTLPRFFYERTFEAKEASGRPRAPAPGLTLVLADPHGLGAALAAGLPAEGTVLVTEGDAFARLDAGHYRVRPGHAADLAALVAAVEAGGARIGRVLHTATWAPAALTRSAVDTEALALAERRGLYALAGLVKALGDRPLRLDVVTARTTGADATHVAPAALLGLVRSAPLELPALVARLVDVEGASVAADAALVAAELGAEGTDEEVVLRDRRRLVPVLAPVRLEELPLAPAPLVTGGLYVITGGLGELGARVAHLLGAEHQAKLLLLGRAEIEGAAADEPRAARLAALVGAGLAVRYRAVDVTDAAAVRAAFLEAEAAFGRPVDGVFHLAAATTFEEQWADVEQHRLLVEPEAALAAQLAPKTRGTLALDAALADRPGALFVAFSSVNGAFGGAGFAAYSAANAFLDAFVAERRARAAAGTTVGLAFSMWETGARAGHAAAGAVRSKGFVALRADEGLAALRAVLARRAPDVLVGLDGTRPALRGLVTGADVGTERLAAWVAAAEGTAVADLDLEDAFGAAARVAVRRVDAIPLLPDGAVDLRALRLAFAGDGAAARVLPRNDVERVLAEILKEVLATTQEVDVRENFFDLGANSISIVRAHARIKERLGLEPPIVELFQHTTIEKLARFLTSLAPATAATEEAAKVGEDRNERLRRRARARQGQ